jgi:predicted permease
MFNLKLAFRTLFNSPFVTIVAIISLALGIGANAAIFSIFNHMLLRPLPVQEPSRLVNLSAPGPKPGSQSCGVAGECEDVFSYAMFRDLERSQTVFTGIAAHVIFGVNLAYQGQTMNGDGMQVSGSYFSVLGLQPALGRLLDSNDDRAIGESPVVVLSHGYWQSRFGSNPNVLNQQLIVNGQHLTIVGVAPRGFEGTSLGVKPEVFVPITMRAALRPGSKSEFFTQRRNYWAYLFARLKPGVTIEQARTGINVPYRGFVNDVEAPLQEGMSEQTMARFRTKVLEVTEGPQGQSSVHGEARAPLILLLGVTALVLVIACANIANLLLARSAKRAAEMAVRLSIGASRWQLILQLLTESVLLAVFGGLAGLAVAQWTLTFIAQLLPEGPSGTVPTELDVTVLMFAAVLTLGTGLLFGLFPAFYSTRPDLASTLKGASGQPSGARGAARFRATLATAQIALSMMLLVSAGLFTKSLFNVTRVDLGLKQDHLATFGVSPLLNAYTFERAKVLFERLEDALAAQPGVTGVTASTVPVIAGSNWGTDVRVQGFQSGPDIDSNARFSNVAPGHFRTMGIPMIAGREFTRSDARGAPKVAIVNEAFLKKFHLGRGGDAVGKFMSEDGEEKLDIEIVGVVKDAKYSQVKQEVPALFFRPYRQIEQVGSIYYYVRTTLEPAAVAGTLPKVVAGLDPNLPVEDLRTMEQQVKDNVFLDRVISVLSASFAVLATLLAAVGLYGVLAYTVAQRTREIGLRMALGAEPGRVRGMVLRQVGVMAVVGGIIGLSAALVAGWYARSLLFELQNHDPVVLVGSALGLAAVALVAGLIPAHRASRIDPMTALRYQ